ncbi:MAG: MBL fold metallo-hydrolase [Lautropia sp.]|nr:MBL fold metallo-hydrolase [Lautropia sp.]
MTHPITQPEARRISMQQRLATAALGSLLALSPGWLLAKEARPEVAPVADVVGAPNDAADKADKAAQADSATGQTASSATVTENTPQPASAFVQVPGVYRQQIGQLQVTALLDGTLWLPAEVMKGLSGKTVQTMLREMHVPKQADGSQLAINVLLVRRGDRLMLVDAGSGRCMGDGVGKLLENLKHAGVSPEQITDVLLTHAHPDHVCGLLGEGDRAVFGKATLWLSDREGTYWLSDRQKRRAPKDAQPYFDMAVKALQPYQAAGRLKLFAEKDQLPPGVTALQTPGHTPGHVSWLIDGAEKSPPRPSVRQRAKQAPYQLLVWGDIVHMHAVQFAQPGAWLAFDVDPEQAIKTRKRMLARASQNGWWVAGAHLPFPGIGHVAKDRQGYRWLPAEFGPVIQP